MATDDPWAAFNPQAPAAPAPGRSVIRKGVEPTKPDLPEGYTTDPNPKPAVRVPGLPVDKWERAQPADLEPLGVSGPYLINRSSGEIKLVDTPKTDPTKKSDPADTIAELTNVIGKSFRAKELSRDGWFSTGFGASAAKNLGGTTAADVKGILDTIGGNQAFDRLQKMRDNSPTGGALGAISERELDLLKSTIASLDQSQSDEQFQNNMQDIVNAYGRVLLKIPGGRAEMIKRGWLPKEGGTKAPPQKADKGGVKFLGFE